MSIPETVTFTMNEVISFRDYCLRGEIAVPPWYIRACNMHKETMSLSALAYFSSLTDSEVIDFSLSFGEWKQNMKFYNTIVGMMLDTEGYEITSNTLPKASQALMTLLHREMEAVNMISRKELIRSTEKYRLIKNAT